MAHFHDTPTEMVSDLARTTPVLVLGPYYPVQLAADADARLWRGTLLPDDAQPLQFRVRVVARSGQPVVGACVETWHADHAGRYPHPSARDGGVALPGFTGYGIARTGIDGSCQFDTLCPGAYLVDGEQRARHLHLQITGRMDRLVTQVFLADDAQRFEDRWYLAASRPDLLVATIVPGEGGARSLVWTAVLASG